MHGASEYQQQLKALLPAGKVWDSLREEGKLFGELLAAIAEEFARVDASGEQFLDEADPRSALQLLQEWEGFAIPDSCVGFGTIQQRQDALLEALTGLGGQSRQYFIDLAESLGFTLVSITEYEPFSVMSGVSAPLHLPEARFVWKLSATMPDVQMFTVMSGVSEGMGDAASTTQLECLINKYKPAHTTALFEYI